MNDLTSVSVAPVARSVPSRMAKTLKAYGKVSLSFEANQGQADGPVKFLSRGSGHTLFLTSTEAVVVLANSRSTQSASRRQLAESPERSEEANAPVLRMKLAGSNPTPEVTGVEELPGKTNYFSGKDPTRWRTNIPTYARVRYRDIYPGVDVVYYGNQGQLEHDFVVAPGADPQTIALGFEDADRLEVDARGDLVIHVAGRQVRQHKPLIYQEANGVKQNISGGYVLRDKAHVGFHVAAYDVTRPLVIDPVLAYSTYLGGSGDDFGCGIVVDAAGNAYVVGWASSIDFPTTPGAYQPLLAGTQNAFVVKLNPQGNTVLYSTYVGGEEGEFEVIGITVDGTGSAYITGLTHSAAFPTTPGAYQQHLLGFANAFVTKLDPSGSALVYSTYLGGSDFIDAGQKIVVDSTGNAYVAGLAGSQDFPTTPGAAQPSSGGGWDAFVAKINPSGSALVYSTFLGGSDVDAVSGLVVDAAGNAYVAGSTGSTDYPTTPGAYQRHVLTDSQHAFVTKLDPTGSVLVFSSYLGGSHTEEGRDVAVDNGGNVYVAGITTSADFPTTAGAFQTDRRGPSDAFVAKLISDGSTLVYSTLLGGTGDEITRRFLIDDAGNAYVSGATTSADFPVTKDAIQASYGGGEDAFVTKINPAGSAILFSTFLGGSGNDRSRGMTVDASRDIYVTGFTGSTDFPTVNAIQSVYGGGVGPCFFQGGCDAFIVKIGMTTPIRTIPTMSKWAQLGLALILVGVAVWFLRIAPDSG